jgi:Tol biopolymer transport system component
MRDGPHLADKAAQVTLGPVGEQGPAVSPDGKWLAFEYLDADKKPEVWIMPIEGDFKSARPLFSSPYRDAAPTWSPDSRWVAFICATVKEHLETDQVCKVAPQGGQVVQVTHFPPGSPGVEGDIVDWLADGRIAFRHDDSIYTIPSEGGGITELLNLGSKLNLGGSASSSGDFYDLRVSPNGERVAFMFSIGGQDNPRLGVVDLKTGKFTRPVRGFRARFPGWINNNWLLYAGASKGSELTQIWALCLSTGKTEALTSGQSDIEPTFSSRLGAIFFPHSSKAATLYDALYNYHIWRQSLPRSTIERWFRGNEGHSERSQTTNPKTGNVHLTIPIPATTKKQ